ncbi:type VI secretion system Vgr family protein [Paraburkholderia phenoliruptrix]|uniref:type VI secretion system Vgr family protein n=1 Tax=Paraburkholderia phenoliruptrix TaxID=252970 RepID=UPI0001C02A48|nr:Rhs element Vgr protein [Paraburkholderia phenoliruptrix]
MTWNTQPRTLDAVCDAFPKYGDASIFVAGRLCGSEKLGGLFDYEVDVSTVEAPGLYVNEMHEHVDVNRLVGKRLAVRIAIEGNGTWDNGEASQGGINVGADVREIAGVIAGVKCLGADDRRAFYRLRLRPWLWLATLNRDSKAYLDQSIEEITREVLGRYPFPVEWMLSGPGWGRKAYPTRDYQRQFWESDYEFLSRLWEEWGITYHFIGMTLVLRDAANFSRHGPAYRTLRYIDRGGQRVDEEHIHELQLSRELTPGRSTVVEYDYTQATANLTRTIAIHRDATHDNAEEYTWADSGQPQQGAMGLNARRNDQEFEADHLARLRVEARRCKSLRIRGKGNLRGVTTGFTTFIEGFPVEPVNGEYLVTGTWMEIVNNDTITQRGALRRQYSCKTKFTAQPANQQFRTQQKAKKPKPLRRRPLCAVTTRRASLPIRWRGSSSGSRGTAWVSITRTRRAGCRSRRRGRASVMGRCGRRAFAIMCLSATSIRIRTGRT